MSLLFTKQVSEISDSIFVIPHQLGLGLGAVELFAVDVGQDGGNQTICGISVVFGRRGVTHLLLRWL